MRVKKTVCVVGGRVFIPWGHPKLRETLDVTVKLIQGRDTKA